MLSQYRFSTLDGPPGLYTPSRIHLAWTAPADQDWPHQCLSRGSGNGSPRLPPEILVQIMFNISQVFSSQDLKNLSLVNTFWSNVGRICRFYCVSDGDKVLALLQQNSKSATSSSGRVLCLFECVRHLKITSTHHHPQLSCWLSGIKMHKKDADTRRTDMVVRLPNLYQLTIQGSESIIVAVTKPNVLPLQIIDLSAIYEELCVSMLRPGRLISVVSNTLAQSQSSLKLFHLESEISLYILHSSLEGIRSLRVVHLRFRRHDNRLYWLLDALSKLHHLEHIYLDYHVAHFTHAYKLWQPPHEYILQVFRGSKVRKLSISGESAKIYLCPKLWRLRREYNAVHPGLSRESKPPPEDLLRTWLCNLTKRYAMSIPSLQSLCIAGINLSVYRDNNGDINTRIVGDSDKWRFLRGTPREDFLAWREHEREYRQSRKIWKDKARLNDGE